MTSVTLSALPSITVPALSRVTGNKLGLEAHGELRATSAQFSGRDGGIVDGHKPALNNVAALFALGDGCFETVIHFARQEILQRAAIALGKGVDDHLIGCPRAGEEVRGIERGIGRSDCIETDS